MPLTYLEGAMEITKNKDNNKLVMAIIGRLDTNAANILMKEIEESITSDIKHFELDMADCDYVASSGLRAILWAQKRMNALAGTMIVKNVVGDVMEVFEMTGFADILSFE